MNKKWGLLLAAILASGILSTQAGYCDDDDYRYNQNWGPQGYGYNNGYGNPYGYNNGYGNGYLNNPGPVYGNGNGLLSRFMRYSGGYPNNYSGGYSGGYMNNGGWGRCGRGGHGWGRHRDGDGDRD